MISRRNLLQMAAAAPLFAPAMLRAQDMSRIAMAPILVRDQRLWIPVHIAGRGPYDFIIDTGAFTNLISQELADGLDLHRTGRLGMAGLGGGRIYAAYRAPDVMLGEVRVGALTFAAYDQEDVRIHPGARGALSAAVMTVADTDLDFDAGLWRLHLDGRTDRTGYEALPSRIFAEGHDTGAAKIRVDVEIDGETYDLVLDTGSPGEIMLDAAATRRSRLWNATATFVPHRRAGLGGDGGRARLVRGGGARIGGMAFDRPIVSITDPASRTVLDADGLLGIGLIERMNLSTDIAGRRLWAKRNARPPRPERYGMSGLWLAEQGRGLVVEEVGTGSPAAVAGIRPGDRIGEGSLSEWIRRLGGRPGDTVEIPVQRGGERRTVALTLREYL